MRTLFELFTRTIHSLIGKCEMITKHCVVFLAILSLTLHVSSENGAKCAVSLSWPYPAVCNDVNSLRDIVDEIQPSWTNLKINNGIDRSFAMDALGIEEISRRIKIQQTVTHKLYFGRY